MPQTAIGGQGLTYTARVANAGPQPALGTVLTLTLPAEIMLRQIPDGCNQDGRSLLCSLGDLDPGPSDPVVVTVDVPRDISGTLVCSGTVNSAVFDPDLGDNQASLPTTVQPYLAAANLSLLLSASPQTATGGSSLLYTAHVANAGPDVAASTVLTLTLPAQVPLPPAPAGCRLNGRSLVCSLGDLAAGQSAPTRVRVDVPFAVAQELVCRAAAGSATGDPHPGDSRRSLVTPVQPYPSGAALLCDGPNLLANGGFEQGFQGNGVARSWTAFDNGAGANYEYRGDAWNRAVSEGAHSQLIEINTFGLHVPAGTNRVGGIYQKAKLRPGYIYELSFDALLRERDPQPGEDPYRFMVGWGYSRGSGTDQARMEFREWLPVHNIYPMLQPGGMQSHSKQFKAPSDDVTIWLYATKKWPTGGQELNVNLDNVALRICRPVTEGKTGPRP